MAYQSLYRRYRPRRFSEVRGQQHLVRALQNAVREERVGHAYLFSGPRGTGKTTTARILAKVLNCEAPVDGEPCCACASCLAIEAGTSFDVHELDAASNNKVDDIRDLITKAALGTPGRTKVYILDEVHMLTAAASNALLKTLEEPPDHVVFVLATTDPQKVLPTIRSRTQHFEVHLLPAADLRALVTDVIADAGLDVDEAGIEHVLRAGNGSARDTLSALDQVVAAGGVPTDIDAVDRLVEALCDADTGAALLAVESGCNAGANPRVLGEALIARLRDVFLTAMGSELDRLSDRDRERVADQARRLGPAGATRALEVLGEAFVTIADAPDQRIPLEVALVRLTRPEADTTLAALAQRIDRLEQGSTAGTAPTRPAAAPPATASVPAGGTAERRAAPADDVTEPTTAATGDADAAHADSDTADVGGPPPTGGGRPAAAAREVLARTRKGGSGRGGTPARSTPGRDTAAAKEGGAGPGDPADDDRPRSRADGPPASDAADDGAAPREPEPPSHADADPEQHDDTPSAAGAAPAAAGGGIPGRDELTLAWGDTILPALPQRARARFGGGRWHSTTEDAARYALPNAMHRDRCAEVRGAVEEALEAHFGRPVPIALIIDDDSPPPAGAAAGAAAGGTSPADAADADDEWVNVAELDDADPARSHVDRVADIFPGAALVEE